MKASAVVKIGGIPLALVTGAQIAVGVAELGFALLMKLLVDALAGRADDSSRQLTWVAIGYAALGILIAGLTYAGTLSSSVAKQRITAALQRRIFASAMANLGARSAVREAPTVNSLATNDVRQVAEFVAKTMPTQVFQVARAIGGFVAVGLAFPRLLWLIPVAMTLMWVVPTVLRRRVRGLASSAMERVSHSGEFLIQALSAVFAVRSMRTIGFLEREFDTRVEAGRKAEVRLSKWGLASGAGYAGLWVSFGAAYWLVGQAALRGEISPGTAVALAGLVSTFALPLSSLGSAQEGYQVASASWSRICKQMQYENREVLSDADEPRDAVNALDLKNVEIVLDDDSAKVLNVPRLVVPIGMWIGVAGASGSGKSALVEAICGQRSWRSAKQDSWLAAGSLGIATDSPVILPVSIRDNILLGRDVEESALASVVSITGLNEILDQKSAGLSSMVGEWSLGERQRLGLARAIVGKPSLLVLDEATGGLDMQSEARVLKAVREWTKDGSGVLVISHREATIVNADRVWRVVPPNGEDGNATLQPHNRD
ncbi:ABC transporter transmembrane domain-containing protein [Streptomyces sp. bgisy031]|uniref:ABC transporter transmembrane domain-containing protein n=1 Tax=Streptomyces sp. bgisy031 TaxID=3413772 RepID=UPI003D752F46